MTKLKPETKLELNILAMIVRPIGKLTDEWFLILLKDIEFYGNFGEAAKQ